jgi:hypothetical protein
MAQLLGGCQQSPALHVVTKLDISTLLKEEPSTVAEIAERSGARPQLLDRLIRRRADGDLVRGRAVAARLAFLGSLGLSLVPGLLRDFRELAPNIRVTLCQEPHHELLRDLTSGVAELAVTGPRPAGPYDWIALQCRGSSSPCQPGTASPGAKPSGSPSSPGTSCHRACGLRLPRPGR